MPCAPIANVEEVTRDQHLAARNMILHAEHPEFDGLIVPGSPLKSAGDTGYPLDAIAAAGREHGRSAVRAFSATILRGYRNCAGGVSYSANGRPRALMMARRRIKENIVEQV